MFSAKVKGGVIVAEDVDLPEGATVTVVVNGPEDDYAELTAEEAAELEAAIAEADRGEGVPWELVRDELCRRQI
jgi:predicted DNA-binding antitoxin AbrB/MazE fold protein